MTPGEIRAELAARLRPGDVESATVLGAGSDDLEAGRAWLAALADGGWAVPTWPRDFGGRDATPEEAAAIAREVAAFHQPDLYPYLVALHVVGPTLVVAGTREQCARWLPLIASGEEIWCQLFSEPGAGSDLANVATRAARDGDSWRVTGQKVWSSRAHYARWGFLLARTDPTVAKHAGITAFALDMAAPGVDVRPLRQMNGDEHFSEVFLEDVVVADVDRIGEVGGGWGVARIALAYERGAVGGVGTGADMPSTRLLDLARGASAAFKATADAALGTRGLVDPGDEWQTFFLTAPSISIRGGTDEIQRNIIGERVLGLPPEPRADTDRPWDEIPH